VALDDHAHDRYGSLQHRGEWRDYPVAFTRESAARQNEAVPAAYRPTSVLGQFQLSAANGRSPEAAQRVLPVSAPGFVGVRQLPSNDGLSQPTNDSQRNLRMAGNLPISTNESA
jgi:hypothetical protein